MKLSRLIVPPALVFFLAMILACGGGKGSKTGGGGGTTKKEYKLGDQITFKDSKWTVISAQNKGNTISSNNVLFKEGKTEGNFILVQFKVSNSTKEEQKFAFSHPKLIDSEGREFKEHDKQRFYIPKGARQLSFEAIPAGFTKEFYAVYEVPSDAKGLKFQARDLTSVFSPTTALVDLGL